MSPEHDAPARIVAGINVFGERVYVTSPAARATTCGREYVRADEVDRLIENAVSVALAAAAE